MRKRTKLVSIIILTLIFVMSSIAFIGCSNKKATEELSTVEATAGEGMFKENVKTEYVIGSVIDIEDYIVKQEGAKRYCVHFEYTNEDGQKKLDIVKGLTYYLTNKGTYLMVYTVELEDDYVRQSIEIEVKGKGLSITTNKYPLVYSLGSTVNLKAILVNANPYCSETNQFNFVKVDYYQTGFDLEETVNEQTKYTKNLESETKFTFDKSGTYEFTISCSVDGESATAIIKTSVVDPDKDGNEYVKVVEENDGEIVYATSNAEIENDIVKLTQADYNSVSYLVLDGTYFDEDVVRVDFKGQNCPQIGLLTQPIENAYNPYALYGGQGFTFSLEYSYKDMFSIWGDDATTGLGRFSGKNLHNGNKNTGYFGLEDLDKDKYYTLEINLSTTSAPDDINVFRLAILEIENYGTANQSYKKVYPTAEQDRTYFEVPAGSSKNYQSGNIVFYSSRYDNITFKIYKPLGRVSLDSFERNDNTVTWDALEGATRYYVSTDGSKYTEQTSTMYTFEEFYENKTPLWVIAESDQEHIALDRKSNGQKVYYNATIYNNILPEETVAFDGDASEFIFANSTNSALSKSADSSKTYVNVTLQRSGQDVLNYVRTKTEYTAGTYAVIGFKGSNYPGVILFGTNESTMSTEHDKTQGIGFYLDNNWGGKTYVQTGSTAEPIGAYSVNSYLDRGYLNANCAAHFGEEVISGNKIRNFVVALGVENVDGGVELNYVLFREKYDGSLEVIQDMNQFIAGVTLQSGSITVGSTRHLQGTTFTYKWYQPQASFTDAMALIKDQYGMDYKRSPLSNDAFEFLGNGGVTPNTNGTYDTVEDDTYDIELPFISALKTNFAKTKTSYVPGTYVMAEFVGANCINGIFFGVQSIGGQDTTENKWATVDVDGVGLVSDDAMKASYYYKTASDTTATTGAVGGNYSKFSRGYFVGNENNFPGSVTNSNKTKTYVVIAGATNVTGGVQIEYLLFEMDSLGTLTCIDMRAQTVSGAVLQSGSIAFNTSVNLNITSKFELYIPDTRANILAKLDAIYEHDYSDPVLKSSDFITHGNNTSVFVDVNGTFDDINDDSYEIQLNSMSTTNFYYAKTNQTYASGTYVMTEFVGANMIPTIFFGVTEIGTVALDTANDYLNVGLTGVGVFAGVQNAGTKYVYRATSTETATASASAKLLYNYGYLVTQNALYDGSTGAQEKTYVLIIGATSVTDGVNIEHMLYEKDTTTNALTLLEIKTQLVSGAVLNTGSILFGSATNANNTAQFRLYTPDTRANIIAELNDIYDFNYSDPIIQSTDLDLSINTGSVMINQNNTFNNTADDYYTVQIPWQSGTFNYATTVKKYSSGTYVLIEYVGANAPMNIFFGVTSAGTYTTHTSPAIVGVGLSANGNHGTTPVIQTTSGTILSGSDAATSSTTAKAIYDRGYLWATNVSTFGLDVENKDATWQARSYVMLIGAVQDGANIVIEYTIYLNEDGTLTELQTKDFTFANQTLNEGAIAFTAGKDLQFSANFNLYTPDTKANLTTLMSTLYTMPNA